MCIVLYTEHNIRQASAPKNYRIIFNQKKNQQEEGSGKLARLQGKNGPLVSRGPRSDHIHVAGGPSEEKRLEEGLKQESGTVWRTNGGKPFQASGAAKENEC